MPENPLQDALRAVQWAYEREEETARLYHNRAQLVLTVVSAFLGVGILKLGTGSGETQLLSAAAVRSLSLVIVIFLLLSTIAAFIVLAGKPGRAREQRVHVSRGLVVQASLLEDLAAGKSDEVAAQLIGQTTEARVNMPTDPSGTNVPETATSSATAEHSGPNGASNRQISREAANALRAAAIQLREAEAAQPPNDLSGRGPLSIFGIQPHAS